MWNEYKLAIYHCTIEPTENMKWKMGTKRYVTAEIKDEERKT
jgi:hypothetical protein